MKTVIIYYTFGGSTKREAERLGAALNVPLYRVKESHNRSLFAAFVPGGFSAMNRKAAAIQPLNFDLNEYDRIIIGCPVWAGYPAPAFNSIVQLLPTGKEVELFLCSGGGNTQKSEQGTKMLIEKKERTVIDYRNVKTFVKPGKLKE